MQTPPSSNTAETNQIVVRKSPLKILAVSVLVLALLAIGCELGLRYVLGLGNPLLSEHDAAAGYVIDPDQHVRRFFCNTDINHWSMRSPAVTPVKPAGTYRILLIGDSMTYGSTQIDQKEIFSSLLQAELPARLHTPVEVLNASAGAWAVGNELGYLRSRGTFGADLVVLVVNSGDAAQPPSQLSDVGGDAATVSPHAPSANSGTVI